MRDSIKFDLRVVGDGEFFEKEGISFSEIAYVMVYINGVDLFNYNNFDDCFVVMNELKKSTSMSGSYLLFTSVSGIADDGGWDYVDVKHHNGTVSWAFSRDDESFTFLFDEIEYKNEIMILSNLIDLLRPGITLEPSHVVYPE